MKVKTLLLGSAAAFAVVGGAQAADLTIAEPIDYVRVCDAMGTGFWYIPGTDTCLRIGGEVSFTASFGNRDTVLFGDLDDALITFTDGFPGFDDHDAIWTFETSAQIQVEAASMTEYGQLTAYIEMEATSDNAQQQTVTDVYTDIFGDLYATIEQVDVERIFYLEEAYIQLGFLKAGYFNSEFRGPGDYAANTGIGEYRPGANTVDQVLLSWALGGFAVSLGIEDPRDNFGTDLPASYDLPVLVGVLEAEFGPFDNRFSGAVGPRSDGVTDYYAWGANATTTIDLSGIGSNALRLSAYFGNDDEWVDEANNGEGLFNWTAFASWRHDITPDVQFNLTGAYASPDGDPDIWEVFGDVVFAVSSRSTLGVGGGWESRDGGVWSVAGELETELVPDQFTSTISAEYHAESGDGSEESEWEAEWEIAREF